MSLIDPITHAPFGKVIHLAPDTIYTSDIMTTTDCCINIIYLDFTGQHPVNYQSLSSRINSILSSLLPQLRIWPVKKKVIAL